MIRKFNNHIEEKMYRFGNLWFRNKYIQANLDKLNEQLFRIDIEC